MPRLTQINPGVKVLTLAVQREMTFAARHGGGWACDGSCGKLVCRLAPKPNLHHQSFNRRRIACRRLTECRAAGFLGLCRLSRPGMDIWLNWKTSLNHWTIARLMRLALAIVMGTMGALLGSAPELAAATLDDVKARGFVVCGLSADRPGFSTADRSGTWKGLDVDFCGALAAAVFGAKSAVKNVAVKEAEAFSMLARGDVDVLVSGAPWTLSRDTLLGARFVGTLFHDGQGLLVPRSHGVSSALELSGASICLLLGTRSSLGVSHYFDSKNMRYQLVTSERWPDVVKAYEAGGCTALTGDISALALERSRFANPEDHILLPDVLSQVPRGPVIRKGDEAWFSVVRWVLMAMISAEEMGVRSDNADSMRNSPSEDVRALLGVDGDLGRSMNLPRDWAFQVIRQLGNYGEVFERHLGQRTAFGLKRRANALWSDGGLMVAAPLR